MNYYSVQDNKHPTLSLTFSSKYSDLPNDFRLHISNWDFPAATQAINVYHNRVLVGSFRYYVSSRGKTKHLDASGTWVSESFRGQKIAAKLWEKALRKVKPEAVYVYTTSVGGHKLICSLKKKYSKIKWEHLSDFS